ncbi:MAG: glycosyltransferase family 4 protein [Candidatus Omnitrophica bacterium]|nr:glycosyltransferase family 4 protein [Candidatus Omnitrophota bacterium]
MNILMINYEYPPLGGGGGVFTRDLANELAGDHNVDVLTTHFRGLEKKEVKNGVNIYRVPVLNRTSLHTATMSSMLTFLFSAVMKGIRLCANKKYHVINTHFAVPTGPVGLVLSRVFNIPDVLSVHGGDIYDPSKKTSPHRHALLRLAVRTVLNSASAVVAQSQNTRDNAGRFYKPSKDIAVIPLGIPAPVFTPVDREKLSMRKGSFYIISIGRLIKRKGYDHLIISLAVARERAQNLELILIGDGPERDALNELSIRTGLKDRVTFLSSVSEEKKFQYLAAADMYVLSSLHEGFGIVLLEAMSCGLPVVATDQGGQTDIIAPDRNGILVPPRDETKLAEAILDLAMDDRRRREISENNRSAAARYSISAVSRRYVKLFKDTTGADA